MPKRIGCQLSFVNDQQLGKQRTTLVSRRERSDYRSKADENQKESRWLYSNYTAHQPACSKSWVLPYNSQSKNANLRNGRREMRVLSSTYELPGHFQPMVRLGVPLGVPLGVQR